MLLVCLRNFNVILADFPKITQTLFYFNYCYHVIGLVNHYLNTSLGSHILVTRLAQNWLNTSFNFYIIVLARHRTRTWNVFVCHWAPLWLYGLNVVVLVLYYVIWFVHHSVTTSFGPYIFFARHYSLTYKVNTSLG